MSPRRAGPAGRPVAPSAVRDALREAGSPSGGAFMRGLTLGALIGAAIAGSALWQRRGTHRSRDGVTPRSQRRP